MSDIVVSIITPMYKGAKYIAQTIDSVIAQSFTDWEMIIVDDCSPDEGKGAAIVKSYAQKDSRIHLIQLTVNKGSSGARNQALQVAKGQYLAFLDSDDIWHTDYLETMLSHIQSNVIYNAAIFFSGYRRMNEDCTRTVLWDYECTGVKTFKKLLYYCPIFPSAAIVDTSKLTKPVIFNESLKNLRDDYVYWLEITQQNLVCVGYGDILVDYRMRGDSLTASKTKMIKPQYNIYHKHLKFGVVKSAFYLAFWAFNGMRKYDILSLKKRK